MQALLAGTVIDNLSMMHAIASTSKAVQAADTHLSTAECCESDLVVGDICNLVLVGPLRACTLVGLYIEIHLEQRHTTVTR